MSSLDSWHELRDQRRHELGLERVEQLRRQHGLGHARAGDRRDRVDEDVALLALERERLREAVEAELGHRVVRLAEVAVDAGGRRGHDDAAVAGVAHVRPRGVGDAERAEHVDLVDEVPVGLRHLRERDVAEDAGVVDDDVDLAERVDRGLDDLVAVLDRVVVGDRLAAGGLDLGDDLVGGDADLPSPVKLPPRSLTTTFAPRDASSSACERPRPPPAPVTIATLPSNLSSAHRLPFSFLRRCGAPAFASTVGKQRLPVVDQIVERAVVAVEHRGHRRADHQLQREIERALEAGVLGDRRVPNSVRACATMRSRSERSAAASTRRSSGSVRAAVRSSIATWKNVPEKHCHSRSSTASVRARAARGSCAASTLELARAHLGEVIDRGDEQLGLRREVVEQGAARDVGPALDLERGRAREADLDQALDRGVEQRAARLVAALLLGARCASRLELRPPASAGWCTAHKTVSQDGLSSHSRCIWYTM